MKNAIIYLRRSTTLQDQSIPDQRKVLQRYAKEHGYRILKEFMDDAVSGTVEAEQREDFINMIKFVEANKGNIDVLLVYDISRLSRGDPDEAGYYHYRLRRADCQVIFASETLPEGKSGELVRDILQWQKREYVKQLARDSLRGIVIAVKQGQKVGGVAPYGYDKCLVMPDGSKYILKGYIQTVKKKKGYITLVLGDPKKVALVQRIFRMYVNKGMGTSRIARILNIEGVPSPASTRTSKVGGWPSSTVRAMLKNPVYTGTACYNRRPRSRFYMIKGGLIEEVNDKPGRRENAESEWIKVENAYEPIIDKEIFRRAQKIMRRRGARLRGRKVCRHKPHLLLNLAYCGHCGEKMYCRTWVQIERGRRRYGPSYRCSGYLNRSKSFCFYHDIDIEQVDKFVLEAIKQQLLSWRKEISSIAESANKYRSDVNTLLTAIEHLCSLARALHKVLKQSARNLAQEKLNASDHQIELPQRANCSNGLGDVPWTLDFIYVLACDLCAMPVEIVRQIVRVLVHKVTLYFRTVKQTEKLTYRRFEKGIVELRTLVETTNGDPQLPSGAVVPAGRRIAYFCASDIKKS